LAEQRLSNAPVTVLASPVNWCPVNDVEVAYETACLRLISASQLQPQSNVQKYESSHRTSIYLYLLYFYIKNITFLRRKDIEVSLISLQNFNAEYSSFHNSEKCLSLRTRRTRWSNNALLLVVQPRHLNHAAGFPCAVHATQMAR